MATSNAPGNLTMCESQIANCHIIIGSIWSTLWHSDEYQTNTVDFVVAVRYSSTSISFWMNTMIVRSSHYNKLKCFSPLLRVCVCVEMVIESTTKSIGLTKETIAVNDTWFDRAFFYTRTIYICTAWRSRAGDEGGGKRMVHRRIYTPTYKHTRWIDESANTLSEYLYTFKWLQWLVFSGIGVCKCVLLASLYFLVLFLWTIKTDFSPPSSSPSL